MALIGKIRRNSWILVVMLGLGLGGFIVMDMTSAGGGGMGGAQQLVVGEVNGEKINWADFQRTEQALYRNSGDIYGTRDYLWNYFVEQAIVEEEAAGNGLSVGDDELEELQFGTNLSPVVRRNFSDPQTNQLNRESLNSFRQALQSGTIAPEFANFWTYQQKEVVKDRLEGKLKALVEKGIYTPTWMAEEHQKELGTTVDFAYVKIPFDSLANDAVTITDADLQKYLDANASSYETVEETRNAKFVVFDVTPTSADSMAVKQRMQDLVEPFASAENDSLYIETNLGTFDVVYYKPDEISPALTDSVGDSESGVIIGPYIDQGAYCVTKVLDRKVIADSVRAKHILVAAQDAATLQRALVKADSIATIIDADPAQFDSLAIKLSEDFTSAVNGGDLGFMAPGRTVKPFNDMIFYQAEPGEVNQVVTQFGVHLIEVTERKFETNEEGIQLGTLREPIIPSEETQSVIYDRVLDFLSNNGNLEMITEASAAEGLEVQDAPGLLRNGFNIPALGSGNTSRDIIRWLFESDTKAGARSPEVYTYEDDVNYFNSKYVVLGLDKVIPKGVLPLADARELITDQVRNEKKGELLKSQITSANLNDIAEQFGAVIDTAENVNFNMQFIADIGNEPDVVAAATGLEKDQLSEPIIGQTGVYVIQVVENEIATLPQNIPQLRQQAAFSMRNAVNFELMEALKKEAEVEDNRFTYY